MQWSDEATILSVRRHGENSGIIRLLTRQHGVCAGVVRGVHGKALRGVAQPGNAVRVSWQARLPEQLGTFKLEMLTPYAALAMPHAGRLAALSSLTALLEAALPEHHPYPQLYKQLQAFFTHWQDELPETQWLAAYVMLELRILAESGFGLDLYQCAATGKIDDLQYISPRSGRAVSRDAGEPYKDKLLIYPYFINQAILYGRYIENIPYDDFISGMQSTGYFLEHWLLTPHNKRLPAARLRFIQWIKQQGCLNELDCTV